jgi:gas vesicle protein
MGLKDSLKRLFTTTKKVGTEKVEESIDQAKEFAKEKTEKLEEVVDEAKENLKEFAKETSEKVHTKAEETKAKIEAKAEDVWEKLEEKAVTVVDNLEAKIRGVEPEAEQVAEPTTVADATVEPTVEATEPVVLESVPEPEKPEEAKKA